MMTKTLTLLAAALAFAAAAGCTKPPRPKTEASAGPSSSPASSSSAERQLVSAERISADDAALTEKVKSALANETGLKALKLDVEANSGVVSVKGQVENDETKQRIQEVAQAVPGVTWVQNQVSVVPKPS
jgi:osmotically-inducible protein OsmY